VGQKHLLSAGADGRICVWRVKDWELLHRMKGNGAPVTAIAVHPSRRLAVSGSQDGTVCMWDLLKGHIAFESREQTKG